MEMHRIACKRCLAVVKQGLTFSQTKSELICFIIVLKSCIIFFSEAVAFIWGEFNETKKKPVKHKNES